MGEFTPWAVCIGVFLIYPALTFVIGFYVGRKGMPFEIKVSRRGDWGKSMADDEYGVTAEAS